MANEKRLIVADALETRMGNLCDEFGTDHLFIDAIIYEIGTAPTVDAAPVVRGWWKEYSHSALVSWKNGEPVWADRAVYRCSGCYFGTIIKHNYCPRCGANMMDGERRTEA